MTGLREKLEHYLQRVWYHSEQPPWPLRGLESLYRGLLERDRRRGIAASEHPGIPVIVVGNLTVGGSGKSPLTIWLAERLLAAGYHPGVVTRGYGRQHDNLRIVDRHSAAVDVGDEALMISIRTGVPVAAAANRMAACTALREVGVNVIISDDGLQHWRLKRDLELLVIDGQRRFGNGHLLPAGPLREPAARLRVVDFVVVNGGDTRHDNEWQMVLSGDTLRRVDGDNTRLQLAELAGPSINAIAGIGHPARFFDELLAAGLSVQGTAFPDHHRYTENELAPFMGKRLLMTEKDAVKCRQFAADQDWWYLPVSAELPTAFEHQLLERLSSISGGFR